MTFEIDKEKYIDSCLVDEKEHPSFPLLIYNYTPKCQFSRAWDEVTMQCRGLIVHKETREIIARPFTKFFNYEEIIATGGEIPTEIPTVYPKVDGSLGILYWWEGNPYMATRGSFTSDQSQFASDFITKGGAQAWVSKLNPKYTYLFEIIYPENRIVVSYGDRKDLILLAVIDTDTGTTVTEELSNTDFPFVAEIPWTSYDELKALNTQNEEGFVLFYPSIEKRIKIKFEDYVRLHKVLTGLSAIGIWESLLEGKPLVLEDIPDEFFDWYEATKNKLTDDYLRIEKAAQELLNSIEALESRRDKAIHIMKNGQRVSSIVFNMLDGKSYSRAIWRMVRPKGMSTFRRDIDA